MPSRRMIDPAIWQSETVSSLTMCQRLLFIGLFSNADDQGRLRGHPALIRSTIFPYDDISLPELEEDLEAIQVTGSILIYNGQGKHYIQIVGWWNYQNPQWAYPSELPAPEGWQDRRRYRLDDTVYRYNWGGKNPDNEPHEYRQEDGTYIGKRIGKRIGKITASDIELGLGLESDSLPTEEASAPSPPKKRKAKPKTETPPAVKTFRSATHRYPAKAWYSDIDQAVGRDPPDLEFWHDVVKAYVGLGWNPTNVKYMLEFYQKREIPGDGKENGAKNAQPTTHPQQLTEHQKRIAAAFESNPRNPGG